MRNARHFWLLLATVVALFLLELLGAAAEGSEAASVARICVQRCSGGGCMRCYGSGTLVDVDGDAGIVVTCAHLFREGASRIQVAFDGSQAYDATLVGRDEAFDLAALRIARPAAEPIPIAGVGPQVGETLRSCGYGQDGRYWCNQGRMLGYVRTTQTRTAETLELSGRARDGDSGGPVFNGSGELVGVLWGTDGRIV